MKLYRDLFLAGSVLGLLGACMPRAHADLPGHHPAYMHALSDLRTAKWLIEHQPGSPAVTGQEDVAIQQINGAIGDIKKAGIDDGKDIHAHEPADVPPNGAMYIQQAANLVAGAHRDVSGEEDDPAAIGLKDRALRHIDAASAALQQATADVYQGR